MFQSPKLLCTMSVSARFLSAMANIGWNHAKDIDIDRDTVQPVDFTIFFEDREVSTASNRLSVVCHGNRGLPSTNACAPLCPFWRGVAAVILACERQSQEASLTSTRSGRRGKKASSDQPWRRRATNNNNANVGQPTAV